MSEEIGAGPGPLTKVMINALWKRLFDAAPANPIYLPRVIRDGYQAWDLPSYDPARPGGTSPPIPIPGVPDEVADSACARDDVPYLPIASAEPALALQNILFTNLSVMAPVSLTFSDTDLSFTAVVAVGSVEQPFTLAASEPGTPNYIFQIACCEPVGEDSRVCSEDRWNADADGQFVARATSSTVSLTVRLHPQSGQPLTISVISVAVDAPPTAVAVDFDVRNKPQWVQDLAQIAINEGVASGALVQGLQTFLNGPDVIQNIEKLANQALKNIIGDPRA